VCGEYCCTIHEKGNDMKKILLFAALAAVSACSQPAPAPEAEASAAPEAAATNIAADGKPSTGTFEVTNADGSKHTTEVKADGTYAVTGADGKVTETGKWEQKSPESYCETADKEGAKQKCFSEKVDDKGVYTSTDPENGKTSTIVRVGG
jgi:hypothetical protein